MLLTAAGQGAGSRPVAAVEIAGLPRKVKVEPGLAPGDSVDSLVLSRSAAGIKQALVDEGYSQAGVEFDTVSGARGVRVRFLVDAGEPVRIGAWTLSGNDSVRTGRLLSVLPRPGARLSRQVLERELYEVLEVYESQGFPFAEVTPARVADSTGFLALSLAVREGPRVRVGNLVFAGNHGCRASVLERVARFRPGAVYSPELLDSWRRNLDRSGLVQIAGAELIAGDEGHGVQFLTEKRRSSRASAALGYVPEDRRLSGFFDLMLRNVLNSGRRAKVAWQAFPGRTRYALSYTEPWVFGWWLSLTGSAEHAVMDTIRSQTSLELSGEFNGHLNVSFLVDAGLDRVSSVVPAENARTSWAGTGFALDTRDSDVLPTRGLLFSVRTRAGERASEDRTRSLIGKVESSFEVTGPVIRFLSLVNAVEIATVFSRESLPEYELPKMGGAKSLRGYYEEAFAAGQLGWLNSELRWRLGRMSAFYPFFDLGVAKAGQDWFFKPGYGLGCRVETRAGTFGLDYGIAWGESPARGKVHLGYESEF